MRKRTNTLTVGERPTLMSNINNNNTKMPVSTSSKENS